MKYFNEKDIFLLFQNVVCLPILSAFICNRFHHEPCVFFTIQIDHDVLFALRVDIFEGKIIC